MSSPARAHERVGLVDREGSEVDFEPQLAARERLDARARADRERRSVERREPRLVEVAREHPDAVAAHLGLRPVGIAVVHEPLGTGCRGIRPLIDRRGPHDAEDAVRADAEPAIAQRRDLVVREIEGAIGVGEDHEVVARAMALREGEGVRHPSILGIPVRGRRDGRDRFRMPRPPARRR